MRTAQALTFAVILAGTAVLSIPASAQRVCDRNCVGPLCNERCVEPDRYRERDLTVGRGTREREVIIEQRRRYREPGVEIRRSRPGVEVEIER